MLSYLTSSTFRKHYDFLDDYKFFSSKFYGVRVNIFRQELKEMVLYKDRIEKNVNSLIQIMVKNSKTPETKVKLLWLLHLLIQILSSSQLRKLEAAFIREISKMVKHSPEEKDLNNLKDSSKNNNENDLLRKSSSPRKVFNPQFKLKKSKSISIDIEDGVFNHQEQKQKKYQQKVLKQLQKTDEEDGEYEVQYETKVASTKDSDHLRASQSPSSKISNQFMKVPTLNQYFLIKKTAICEENQDSTSESSNIIDAKNQEEYFSKNLVSPYATFILKLFRWKITTSSKFLQQFNLTESWTLLNLYKLMLKTSDCFMQMLRYFREPLIFLLSMSAEIFDEDFKKTYSKLSKNFARKFENLEEEYNRILRIRDKEERYAKLEDLCEKYQLYEIKNFMGDLALVNEQICLVYENKYVFDILLQRKIIKPDIIPTQTEYGQLVFEIIEVLEKITKNNLRISSAKSFEEDRLYLSKSQNMIKVKGSLDFSQKNVASNQNQGQGEGEGEGEGQGSGNVEKNFQELEEGMDLEGLDELRITKGASVVDIDEGSEQES